jgi:hypothetical protein
MQNQPDFVGIAGEVGTPVTDMIGVIVFALRCLKPRNPTATAATTTSATQS